MKRPLVVALFIACAVALAWSAMTRPNLPPAERGRRLAERHGCLGCHGANGVEGAANPGRTDRTVPGWSGDLMMYASDAAAVREWILDGAPAKKRASEQWRAQRDAGALVMPAYRGRLSARDADDLVAYVMAVNGSPAPADSLARAGLERATALGCVGCHGAGGRLARPNPGSFKGVIPSWDGRDFTELVRDQAEFGAWVEKGVAPRFAANPVAAWFLARADVRMPAYERHLAPGDVDALWAYVQWLRSPAAAPDSAAVEGY
ncbi:MAG: hypothetical protein RL760_1150 [Candidatus Eisenbacteria bacterium]